MASRRSPLSRWATRASFALALFASRHATAEECPQLDVLRAEAARLSASPDVTVDAVVDWMTRADSARRACADTARLGTFLQDTNVRGLFSGSGRFIQGGGQGRTQAKGQTATAGATPAQSGPGAAAGRPAQPPTKGPKIRQGSLEQRLELARVRARLAVRFAAAICGSVARCPETLKRDTLAALSEYVRLVVRPDAPSGAMLALADALVVEDNPFEGVPREAVSGVFPLVSGLSEKRLDPRSPEASALPPELRDILVREPSPQRTNAILRYLLEVERHQRPGDNAEYRTALENLTASTAALTAFERRIAESVVRSLLVDLSALTGSEGCDLRERVEQAAVQKFTDGGRVRTDAVLKLDRKSCPDRRCQVELVFRVDECSTLNSGAQGRCLGLSFRVMGRHADAEERGHERAIPVEPCPSAVALDGLISSVLGEAMIAAQAARVTQPQAVAVARDAVLADPRSHARVREESRGRGIALAVANPSLERALQRSFREVGYRGTGVAVTSRQPDQPVLVLQQRTPDRLALELRDPADENRLLWTQVLTGKNVASMPDLVADRVTLGLIQHYENYGAPEGSDRGGCEERMASRGFSFLLAGLPQLGDCVGSNDAAGVVLALLDSGLLLAAGAFGTAAMIERSRYSRTLEPGALTNARWLFGTSGAALGGVLATRVVGFTWDP